MREIGLLIRLHLYNKDSFLQLSSFIISIPSSLAFFNFEPDFSPATNMSVDLLTLETTLAPSTVTITQTSQALSTTMVSSSGAKINHQSNCSFVIKYCLAF